MATGYKLPEEALDYRTGLAREVKDWLEEQDMSLRHLSEQCGVSASTMSAALNMPHTHFAEGVMAAIARRWPRFSTCYTEYRAIIDADMMQRPVDATITKQQASRKRQGEILDRMVVLLRELRGLL